MKNTAEKVTKLLFGEKVKRLRNICALTKEKLAEKAEVDVKTIHRLEKGEGASPDTLQRVAKALDVPVTEFTMLNLNNGRFTQMSPQQLNGVKESLHELSSSGKINREAYRAMQERIEMAEQPKTVVELPPLQPPPKEVEITPIELTEPLERLDFIGAIKRVLTETKPWVKYAPVDVSQPTLAHILRDRAFISQPYFCDLGLYRVGFFKQGFSSPSALFLAISRQGTNEGLVVRLWPEVTWPPLLPLLYRSLNNNERLFDINLRDFEIYSQTREDYRFNGHQELPELLNATIGSKPNFVLTRAKFWNACGRWNSRPYAEYNPERVIKMGELPAVHIPWNIDLLRSAHLVYIQPMEPMWYRRYFGWVKVELGLGRHYDINRNLHENSYLLVTWPWFFKAVAKFLTVWSHEKYGACLNRQGIDLTELTDQPTSKQKITY